MEVNQFSKNSRARLHTCHALLIELFTAVLEEVDCSVLCGERNKRDQDWAYDHGFTDAIYPRSMHNKTPSLAADVVPSPMRTPEHWKDIARFEQFGAIVLKHAARLGIRVKWGKYFRIVDYPHWELVLDDAGNPVRTQP